MSMMQTPDNISWNAASVELPEMPMIQPGEDAMSATIAAVLPAMAADMTANVASLQAKEGMFSGKVGMAQSAYDNADSKGGDAVAHRRTVCTSSVLRGRTTAMGVPASGSSARSCRYDATMSGSVTTASAGRSAMRLGSAVCTGQV